MTRNKRYNQQKQSNYMKKGRDILTSIAKRSLPLSHYYDERFRVNKKGVTSREVEDRRTFQPLRDFRNPRTKIGGTSRLTVKNTKSEPLYPPSQMSFIEPHKVLLCARRSIRRQVLHAKKIAGGTGFRSPRYNIWSSVSCKE